MRVSGAAAKQVELELELRKVRKAMHDQELICDDAARKARKVENMTLNEIMREHGWALLVTADAAGALQDIRDKANAVKSSIDAILNTPAAIWAGLGASGAAIAAMATNGSTNGVSGAQKRPPSAE